MRQDLMKIRRRELQFLKTMFTSLTCLGIQACTM
jgi:hypothetical protein